MAGKKRRQWSDDEKTSIVAQTKVDGVSVAQVARRYAVNANQIHQWIRNPKYNPDLVEGDDEVFLPVEVSPSFDLDTVIEHPPMIAGQISEAFSVSITTPGGVRLDINDCNNIDFICQLVRGLQ